MMVEHFIITRYNLKKEDWLKDVESKKVLDQDWLRNRNEIFLKYCLPSILNQTTSRFKWILFFQDGSQNLLKPVLTELKKHSFIEAVFCKSYEDFQRNLPALLKNKLQKDSSWVLTTRLDNDDALHQDFVLRLQQSVRTVKENTIFHFPYGLFLDIENKNQLASSYYPMNQFISLLEKKSSGELITVLGREHDKWNKEFKIREIYLSDAWVQITHSRNLANRFSGHPAYSKRLNAFGFVKPKFGIDYDLKIFFGRLLKVKLSNLLLSCILILKVLNLG